MCFPVSYAGFFAKRHMLFFLLSSFRFCPPLKNDGRVVFVLPWCSDDKWVHKRKNRERKPSPDTGKVAAEPSEGVSVSRYVKKFLTKRYYMPACHSWTVVKSWFDRDGINRIAAEWRIQDLNILTCVRRLAPIASQARHFPPSSGEAND